MRKHRQKEFKGIRIGYHCGGAKCEVARRRLMSWWSLESTMEVSRATTVRDCVVLLLSGSLPV